MDEAGTSCEGGEMEGGGGRVTAVLAVNLNRIELAYYQWSAALAPVAYYVR